MAKTVSQDSVMPTRKMLAFALSSIITAALLHFSKDFGMTYEYASWLTSETAQQAIPIIAGAVAGYIVKERA